jgi:thiosulfate dehydrogenase
VIHLGKFLLGVIFGLLLIVGGAYIYISKGFFPTEANGSPFPLERKLAMRSVHSRADRLAPKDVPFQPSDSDYLAGAWTYREHCSVCHGLPDQPKTAIAKGLYPTPPELFKGIGVTDDPAGETYWKVANGIRLTGMPAFAKALPDQQIWQVSLLLANSDKLPAAAVEILKRPPAGDNPGGVAAR